MTPQEAIEILSHWADRAWIDEHNVTNGKFDDAVILARNALRGISGNNEEIPSISCKSDKNLQGFDPDYLQSKIDAFTEARKKDGKTSEELLNECRGGELLTWQDVKRILDIGSYIADYNVYHNIPIVDEAYYTEVLEEFNEGI